MQVGQYASKVETGGVKSKKMKIESNAKAFSMIIDKLYTDIKYAIVRELMTNGYDSQKEAGNPERPLYIKIPTVYDQTMAFRDYGVSMTHEIVEDVFSTLMASTKDKAEDAVGGWGIGSKTPLGYTDQLSLRAFLNGSVRLYHVFIDGEGIPNITLVGEEPTEEDNGIEISFEVLTEDISAFRDNVNSVVKWFDVKPNTSTPLGFEPGKQEYSPVIGQIYEIGTVKYQGYGRAQNKSMQVRQGCVAYPLDTNKLKPNDNLTAEQISKAVAVYNDFGRTDGDIFIDVPIGTADVTASRDALYYSEKTCTNIVQAFASVYDELHDALEVEWAKVTTYFEACRLETAMCSLLRKGFTSVAPTNIVRSYLSNKTFNGKVLRSSVSFRNFGRDMTDKVVHKFVGCKSAITKRNCSLKERMMFKPSNTKAIDITYADDLIMVVDFLDPKTGKYTRNSANRMARYYNEQTEGTQILWVQVNTVSLDGLVALMEFIGIINYKKLADLPMFAKDVAESAEYVKRDLYRYTEAPYLSQSTRVVELEKFEDVLLQDNYMYLNTFRTNLATEYNMNMSTLERLTKDYHKANDTTILLVTKTINGKLATWLKGKEDFHTHLINEMVKAFDAKAYVELKAVLNCHVIINKLENISTVVDFFDYWEDKAEDKIKQINDKTLRESVLLYVFNDTKKSTLRDLEKHLEDINTYASEVQKEKVRASIELLSKVQTPPLTMAGLEQANRDIGRKYPWLDSIRSASTSTDRQDAFIALLNRLAVS